MLTWFAILVSVLTIVVGVWSSCLSSQWSRVSSSVTQAQDIFWVRVLGVSLTVFILERIWRVEQGGLILGFVIWWLAMGPIVALVSIFAAMGLRESVLAMMDVERPRAGSL
ncbi:hypothetical protein SAMN05421693_1207 [Ectothiorhodospira magna]|uniref:Uncharacterized protein n=1 Tax=Ectothiorhodospira magna TaxID=867345 RepID=A0A1H9E3X4_9GAMM|nr:hypothetical protein [Ectothiorhodospira magna]SEQ20292.1 hypothetical protein SAMN05421693_1207 [Ectothiorhodospira magna]